MRDPVLEDSRSHFGSRSHRNCCFPHREPVRHRFSTQYTSPVHRHSAVLLLAFLLYNRSLSPDIRLLREVSQRIPVRSQHRGFLSLLVFAVEIPLLIRKEVYLSTWSAWHLPSPADYILSNLWHGSSSSHGFHF